MSETILTNRVRPARQILWTETADYHLIRMRKAGASLRAMAAAFGLSRSAVTERSRRLGLTIPSKSEPTPRPAMALQDSNREPLPAGHILSWGLITQGTCLEGEPYTPPVPIRCRRKAQ